jgi:hypothetical protein
VCCVQPCQGVGRVLANVLDVADHVTLLVVAAGLAPVETHAPVGNEGLTGAVPVYVGTPGGGGEGVYSCV